MEVYSSLPLSLSLSLSFIRCLFASADLSSSLDQDSEESRRVAFKGLEPLHLHAPARPLKYE